MTAPSSLLGHRHDAVARAGNGSAHEEQVALRIHLDDGEPQFRVAARALVARHPLALDDARRVGARSDGARLPVARVAVAGRPAAKAMAMHHALEATALAGAGDLDHSARGEDVHLHLGARRRRVAGEGKFPHYRRRCIEARRLGMAELGPGGARGALRAEAQLHAAVAAAHDAAGPGFNDGDRHRGAVFRKDPGHPELAADESVGHGYSTLISTSTPAGRSSLVSASMVAGRESLMSSSRLWVRSSNCSRLFLSTCGLRSTVHRSVFTGSGIGPATCAPVFSAVRTMSAAAWSRTTWSKAFRRIRMFWAMCSLSRAGYRQRATVDRGRLTVDYFRI